MKELTIRMSASIVRNDKGYNKQPKFVVNFWNFSALFSAGLASFLGFQSWSVAPRGCVQRGRTAYTAGRIFLACPPKFTK